MNRNERRRLAKTTPVDHGMRLNETFLLHQRGDLQAAEAGYRNILTAVPDHPDAVRLLGEVLLDRGKAREAVVVLRRLARLQPDHFGTYYTLGSAFRMTNDLDSAIEAFQTAIRLNPDFAGAHHGLGLVFRSLEREQDAASCFQLAVKCKPDWAAAWKDLGLIQAILGDLPKAAEALQRAVSLDPGLGEARRHLAAINGAESPASMPASQNLPVAARIEWLFAKGREEDQANRFDAAFSCFEQANLLLRGLQRQAGIEYNRARMSGDVDQLIATFNPAAFRTAQMLGNASEQPVFILGMPRAGSTLFEQIAASHSQIAGIGERKGIGAIANRLGWRPSARWTAAAMQHEASGYLQALQAAGGDALRIIDKMPDNIFQLGLIATLFPNARVIFCERDPRDISLSCYFQHFSEPLAFDTDLDDIAHRLMEIGRLTTHWCNVLPLRFMTMSYEALLADPEGESRRMIAFLGLDWEPACLEFHQTIRPVRTASWAQVRQPLYQRAQGRWRSYAPHIAPLLARFSAPRDPHDGALPAA